MSALKIINLNLLANLEFEATADPYQTTHTEFKFNSSFFLFQNQEINDRYHIYLF